MKNGITRRESLALGMAGLLTLGIRPAVSAARLQESFGGNGGVAFAPRVVQSIGIRSGAMVDALILNGDHYGGYGGGPSPVITLEDNDYIKQIDVRAGVFVDHLTFTTKSGSVINGGGNGGIAHSLSNIRVTRLGGRCGALLDQISIEYVPNYAESVVMETGGRAIFAVSPPGSQIQEYQEKEIQTLRAYESIFTTMLSQLDANGSVDVVMYAAKMSGTLSTTTNTQSLRESIEERKKTSSAQTINIPANAVGILVGSVSLMKSAAGMYWLKPEVPPSWLVFNSTQWGSLDGLYDVTGAAAAIQMGMKTNPKNNLLILSK